MVKSNPTLVPIHNRSRTEEMHVTDNENEFNFKLNFCKFPKFELATNNNLTNKNNNKLIRKNANQFLIKQIIIKSKFF